jgi:hypothetical protein
MGILNGRGMKRLLLLDCVDWFHVAQDRNKWRAVVNIGFMWLRTGKSGGLL